MHELASKCVQNLVATQGKTEDEATAMVCKHIEDSAAYQPNMIMTSMKMTFLDKSVEDASQNIINNILK